VLTVSDAKSRTVQNWLRRGLRRSGRNFRFQCRCSRIVYVFGWIVYVFDTTLDLWCGGMVYVFGWIVYVFGIIFFLCSLCGRIVYVFGITGR
jgi:hypothetical protein